MKRFLITAAMLGLTTAAVQAATIINKDDNSYALVVSEGGQRSEIALGAGQTITICHGGCFLTLPNGDREVLSGNETVEISGGRAKIK